ncbi:MAG TPA: hypothetical protein VHR86_08825 [Armatimonadota bacterium]|nr:hypothetical protein [Armatimonadota bacterium]
MGRPANGLWLACHTQEEIAEVVDTPRQTITDWEKEFAEKSATDNSANFINFAPPIYNVWKQQDKSNSIDHFGNSEPKWEDEFAKKSETDNFANSPNFGRLQAGKRRPNPLADVIKWLNML